MGKKDKKKKGLEKEIEVSGPIISRRGWKLIGGGIGTVILGFIVLSFTDPMGQNFASTLSPILLISGYTLIGVGIITKDPLPPASL